MAIIWIDIYQLLYIFINVKVKFWCDIVGSKKPPSTVDDIYSVNTHLLKVNPTYKQQDKQLNKCR